MLLLSVFVEVCFSSSHSPPSVTISSSHSPPSVTISSSSVLFFEVAQVADNITCQTHVLLFTIAKDMTGTGDQCELLL